MSQKVDVRCPVCKEWYEARPELVGTRTVCGNCRQEVIMVPRSSQARAWMKVLVVLIVLGGIVLAVWLYQARLDSITRTLSGPAL